MDDRQPLEQLESLLFDWEEGTLDDAGVARVREILRSNEEAQKFYVRHQMLAAALTLEGQLVPEGGDSEGGDSEGGDSEGGADAEPSVKPSVKPRVKLSAQHSRVAAGSANRGGGFRMNYRLATVAGLAICLLSGRLLYVELNRVVKTRDVAQSELNLRDASNEATSQGVALLTRLVDIEWGADQAPVDVGDALMPGRFAVKSGYAQVEFFCGATVIIEGPAELDLKSATLARVRSGRLRAQVPPAARGFSLQIDDVKVVDLGTEFGIAVTSEGADVQVFDGEVEVHRGDEVQQNLTTGQAIKRTASGAFEKSTVTPEQFLDINSMESRARGQYIERLQRWTEWSKELRQDPRLITYYAFDQAAGWNRKLRCSNEPLNGELDGELDGAIVGANRVQGRWPGKDALEFKRPGDRVRVQVPGEYGSLTLACWVKIDSLDRWFNSLFLTDSYDVGEPHWQILDTGQIYFSVRPARRDADGPRDQKVLSPPFWKPSMSGKWLHLVTTYDVESRRITHYLNGEVLHAEEIPAAQLVKTTRIGAASIGNWSMPTRPDAEFAIRNLNGSIDEFAMLAAALTADEIKEMYEHGKP